MQNIRPIPIAQRMSFWLSFIVSPFYSGWDVRTSHVHPDKWKCNNHILSRHHGFAQWFAHMQ